jgi:hypothetical protein
MSDQIDYRARPEQWSALADWAKHSGAEVDTCILELRSRIEVLEAKYETQRLATLEWGKDVERLQRWSDGHLKRIMALEVNSKPIPNPSQIRSSLVERVAGAIADDDAPVDLWHDDARAAICVIAGELRAQCFVYAADWLEQEAKR